jgi:redox-sensitive bicupin YhaK (pirin superfamily)
MKTQVHKSDSRGFADHGWLRSRHTFSFAGFYNPDRVHFGALRVLNDDQVAGGQGFGSHPHDNMEIVSIPLSGDLEHKDSTGRNEVIRQGDVQIMSAGSGLRHSEYNHNKDKAVEFLQIWVFPKKRDIAPRYEQKSYNAKDRINRFQTVVAPTGGDALTINQDAWFSLGNLEKDTELDYPLHQTGHGLYAFILEGEATVGGEVLNKRDAAAITDTDIVQLKANTDTEILLIEVPMKF